MTRAIRIFLLGEAVSFGAAASIHLGVFLHGYEHQAAATAESTIAAVLIIGFGLTWVMPSRARLTGLVAQGFALLGTLVGVSTIVVGVGPRTLPDIIYHVAILGVLTWGLVVTSRFYGDAADTLTA